LADGSRPLKAVKVSTRNSEHQAETRYFHLVIKRQESHYTIELTVPLEEHMEDAYERKMAKYQKLVEESQDQD
jgi:hypothetical protein